MNKLLLAALAVVALSGCARAYYLLDGKRFEDEDSFQEAATAARKSSIDAIVPLQAPVTKRKLITSFPSEPTILAEMHSRHAQEKGSAPRGIAIDQYRNLAKVNAEGIKNFFEAVRKRGIFTQVDIVEANSTNVSLEPSPNYDVLYYSEPSIGTGQYVYASVKYGKQVFAFDRSSPTREGKVKAFVDAVQLLAIRE